MNPAHDREPGVAAAVHTPAPPAPPLLLAGDDEHETEELHIVRGID